MTGRRSTGLSPLRIGIAGIALLGLAACEEGQFDWPEFASSAAERPGSDGPGAGAAGAVELVERDVEAPEVFQVTEAGLWDGRPSLGGVWVAHPDVTDPERVIIRNEANGNFVIGALFRRERDNPGPALQVSSDAAEALGMLAGAPSRLNVIALRREEASVPAPTPAATGTLDAPPEIGTATLDPIAGAAAAIEAAEAAAVPAAAAAPAAATAPAPAAAPVSANAPSRPYIQVGIFSVEANADNTATAMRNAGLDTRVSADESQGRNFWRVTVGPAASEAERARLLDRVKGLGFADAYFVRN